MSANPHVGEAEDHASAQSAPGLYAQYIGYFWRSQRWRLIWTAALMLAVALPQGIGLLMLVPLIDTLSGPGVAESLSGVSATARRLLETLGFGASLPELLGLLVVIASFHAGLKALCSIAVARLRLEFLDSLREELVGSIGAARWDFLVARRVTGIDNLLTMQLGRVEHSTDFVLTFFTRLPVVLAQLLIAFVVSTPLTLGLLALSIPGLAIMLPQLRRSRRLGRIVAESSERIFGDISELLHAIKLTKSFGRESHHKAAFSTDLAELRAESLNFVRRSAGAASLFEAYSIVVFAVLIYVAKAVLSLELAQLLVVLTIFARMLPEVRVLLGLLQSIDQLLPSFAAVRQFIVQSDAQRERAGDGAPMPARVERGLLLEAVGYRYEGGRGVENVTLHFPARQVSAIVGRSGAGKSTLADILMRLLQPQVGQILLDGHPAETFELAGWRRGIGYVPQDPFLFHQSIERNLRWAKPDASADEIWRALSLAAADKFVAALPRGLQTEVGDRGSRLSMGERQRLSLARALLLRPPILVLDEVSSALDAGNEALIHRAIAGLAKDHTVIVIAHRLNTIRAADVIHVLDNGCVRESGSWDDLTTRPDSALNALLSFGAT